MGPCPHGPNSHATAGLACCLRRLRCVSLGYTCLCVILKQVLIVVLCVVAFKVFGEVLPVDMATTVARLMALPSAVHVPQQHKERPTVTNLETPVPFALRPGNRALAPSSSSSGTPRRAAAADSPAEVALGAGEAA
jgi:hypothetical protein